MTSIAIESPAAVRLVHLSDHLLWNLGCRRLADLVDALACAVEAFTLHRAKVRAAEAQRLEWAGMATEAEAAPSEPGPEWFLPSWMRPAEFCDGAGI